MPVRNGEADLRRSDCYRAVLSIKRLAEEMMFQFYHSHPNEGVKGIRVLYHIVNGHCTYIHYLPDQT